MTSALIDNGKIKILDTNGQCYEDRLLTMKAQARFYLKLCHLSLIFTSLFFLATISPIFYDVITSTQNWFFAIMGVVSLFFFMFFQVEAVNASSEYHKYQGNYYLAKQSLQDDIMELEKKLTHHQSEINAINTKAKFNFKLEEK